MKDLQDNLGQLIFWSIAFGIFLGIISLVGCETPAKKYEYETVPAPVEGSVCCSEECVKIHP